MKKVLIVNTGVIGDLLATTPLIEKLSESNMKVDILINPEMKPIFKNNKNINNILTLNQSRGFINSLKNQNYDLAILIYPNTKEVAKLLLDSKIPYRIADVPYNIFGFHSILFNNLKKPIFSEKQHKVAQNLEFAKIIGLELNEINFKVYPMQIYLKKEEVLSTIRKFNLKNKFVIISPGSRSQIRMGIKLPKPEKFAEIADYINKRYKKKVLLVGSKKEIEICRMIKEKSFKKDIINLADKTNLRELMSIIKLSDLLIGIDSGNIHIAASFNKKIVNLMRKSQIKVWYPWTEKKNFIILSKGENLDAIQFNDIKRAVDKMLK